MIDDGVYTLYTETRDGYPQVTVSYNSQDGEFTLTDDTSSILLIDDQLDLIFARSLLFGRDTA